MIGISKQCGPRRLAIVSDDPLFVEVTSLGFRSSCEFAVFHCPAMRHGVAGAILRGRFDAVMIDDVEKTDDALDLVREITRQAERTPVYVLSACTSDGRHESLLAAGATAVISKATRNGALVTFVRETLCGRILFAGMPSARDVADHSDEVARFSVVA